MATLSMQEELEALRHAIETTPIDSEEAAEAFRIRFLGQRSGQITHLFKRIREAPPEERPRIGQQLNALKRLAEQRLEEARARLRRAARPRTEVPDLTLPGRRTFTGSLHPLTRTLEAIVRVFEQLGFSVAEGPEIEDDWHNFTALNFPPDHPARDMQDSFYITEDILMRTHTSPVQVRTMERMNGEVPVKIICPGKVYRRDNDDATHSHMFTQIEGLVIDRHIRMSDLKGTLLQFAREMFGKDARIRMRPSYFPFTEPSAEVDVSCMICRGDGCRTCKQTGWLEILGSGMVHPRVLEMSGYDPNEYSGFAFGMGVERIAMLKYGIDDIRHFYLNDVRFLQQFARI